MAGALGTKIRGHAAAAAGRVFSSANLSKVGCIGIGYLLVATLGIALLGRRTAPFLVALPFVFALAWIARVLAGNRVFVDWGIDYVIFALLIGLLINNTVGTPRWLMPPSRPSSSSRRGSSFSVPVVRSCLCLHWPRDALPGSCHYRSGTSGHRLPGSPRHQCHLDLVDCLAALWWRSRGPAAY